MFCCEFHCCLDVAYGSSIYPNNWYIALGTRHPQSSVRVTSTYGPVVKYEALEIRRLHGPGLIGPPISVKLIILKIGTVS